ncbi:hypothetical protein P5V15_007108 [Pogonomyrmex californicus]
MKYCVSIFDEMKLDASLIYNSAVDMVENFTDDGYNRKIEIADHALIMKTTCGFFFCKSTTSWKNIVLIFKNIVIKAHDAGLKVVAFICDQGSKIIPLYDPPHLLKCIRNNLLKTYNLN